jgi:hypothetical protein
MIVVAGESLIDLIPNGPGQLIAHCGGGPFNTAQALARLGQRVSFLGSISDDALGPRLGARMIDGRAVSGRRGRHDRGGGMRPARDFSPGGASEPGVAITWRH